MKCRMVVGLVAAAAGSAAAQTYTFETLTSGSLHAQDNWAATGTSVVRAGGGSNASKVYSTTGPASGSRINDSAWWFPRLSRATERAVLAVDFRVQDPLSWGSMRFSIAEYDHPWNSNEDMIGISYYSGFHHVLIFMPDGRSYAGGANNFPDRVGDWFRVELRIDFTAYDGDGAWSVFTKNLTAGDPGFLPVAPLQNLPVGLVRRFPHLDPAVWDRMDVQATNVEVDNLTVSAGCWADCDPTTGPRVLDVFDFLCFQNRYAAGDPYACGCDTSTGPGVCDVFDFLCFQNAFAAGCP